MFVTLKELAKYLDLPVAYLEQQIQEGNVKALFDGENWLVNQDYFERHKEQLEQLKKQLLTELESLTDDWDAKDED
ncbi:excisionase family DNA-binding protein [Halalkalibacter sp. APA_J-10(15)]|uniref:excisionase family DNA-binding protein n=1 Tax=Halalkalibacter sp. APA_J-10(15) TaxID=2933805 RepID=UPI001FF63AD1|nr:excisionase family DNA-binding protein [Halalkalibacter sp. APA_J-10(15)]MCK0472623.1 excisionase family DNA-binding protein [Halalkalibacter sp. APA_J-10(15)]